MEKFNNARQVFDVSEKQSLAKIFVGVKGGIIPICANVVIGKNYCGGPGGGSPPGGGLEAAAHKVFLLTLILTLILILLPPKGGLGAQPQGFDFDFFA